MKKIWIEKDDKNGIIICADNYKGISIQLVRFCPTLKPDSKNMMVTHITEQLVWSETVPCYQDGGARGEIPVDGNVFKGNVKTAIERIKKRLFEIEYYDSMIDGALNDYESQERQSAKSS